MRSRGADSAAMASVSPPYPANTPCTARRAKMCQARVTYAMADMTMTKLTSERSTISLRP